MKKPTVAGLRRKNQALGERLANAQKVTQRTQVAVWRGLPDKLVESIALSQKLGFVVEVRISAADASQVVVEAVRREYA